MKTKRILAMLMAMCMLAACSMVVSAEGEINYLSLDETISGGLPAKAENFEAASGMSKIDTPVDFDNDGVNDAQYYFSLDSGKWGRSGAGSVTYQTHAQIPAQKYLLTGWYKTDTTFAHIQAEWSGLAKVSITLPATGTEWKQFFIILDASYGTTSVTDPDTGDVTTYFNDENGSPTETGFNGLWIRLMKPKIAQSALAIYGSSNYMYFCSPVLTPLTTDITGVFETGIATACETSSIYYCLKNDGSVYSTTTEVKAGYAFDIDKVFNILGAKVDSVAAGSEATFKFAPAALSVEAAKAQAGQIVLATYEETAGVKTLTGVEIVSSTAGIGGATCTIPAAFAGKTVKAFFWNSLGALTPIAAPATVTVPAA